MISSPPPCSDFKLPQSISSSQELMSRFRNSGHLGVGQGLSVMKEGFHGVFEVQACYTSPANGNGELMVTGPTTKVSKDGVDRWRAFIENYRRATGEVLGISYEETLQCSLYRSDANLHVHFASEWRPIMSSCQMGAIFVCLVSLMYGKPSREDTAVVGDLSNEGNLIGDGTITSSMVKDMRALGIRHVVRAEGIDLDEEAVMVASQVEEDGMACIKVVQADGVKDVVKLCF